MVADLNIDLRRANPLNEPLVTAALPLGAVGRTVVRDTDQPFDVGRQAVDLGKVDGR